MTETTDPDAESTSTVGAPPPAPPRFPRPPAPAPNYTGATAPATPLGSTTAGATILATPGSTLPSVGLTQYNHPPVPITPSKFGCVCMGEDGKPMRFLGGPPLPDWSGLDGPKPHPDNLEQCRPSSVSASIKSRDNRTAGLPVKYSKPEHREQSLEDFTDHLVCTGMDTPTYLPDPADPTTMLMVTQHYPKFTLQSR